MDEIKTLDEINMTCSVHNSPIGGVCSDNNCQAKTLLCIFCATDENSCIQKFNHQIITFEEYFKKFDRQIREKTEAGISNENFINNINNLNLEEIKADYLKKLNRKEEQFVEYTNNVKSKLKAAFGNEMTNRLGLNEKVLLELKISENLLENLKLYNGFDLIDTNLKEKLAGISNNYTEFKNLLLDGFLDGQVDNKEDNNINISDYKLLNKYILLLKTLQNDKLLKEKLENTLKQQDLLKIYERQLNNSSASFESFLYGLEMTVPNMITSYMIKDIDNVNFDSLRKYTSTTSSQGIFSYSNCELYNTSKKQEYCFADPKQLKHRFIITNRFQTKNTLPEMVNVFTTMDQNKYLMFSTDTGALCYCNYKDGFTKDMLFKTVEGCKGIVFKIDHYFSDKYLKDYIITVTSEKLLYLLIYNADTQTFSIINTIDFPSLCYTFEIVELTYGNPYIITCLQKASIKMYELHNIPVFKELDKVLSIVYSLKAFYNKFTKQFVLILSTGEAITLMNLETGSKIKSLTNTKKKSWYLHALAVETNNDYLIVANMQNDLGVFSYESGKLLRIIGSKTTAYRGIEVWNENYLLACNDCKEIDIYDINTGNVVHNLKNHTKAISGCKRISNNKEEMLVSFSTDGTLMLYT
jgi:WD40 repeat protein